MTYSIEQYASRGQNRLAINIDTDELFVEGLDVGGYNYMGEEDELLALLSDGEEIVIDVPDEGIEATIGHGEFRLRLPDGFLDELTSKLENIAERSF